MMQTENSVLRKNGHDEVKLLMSQGQHVKALDKAQRVTREYGPHIGLACDVICCQYQLGLFSACSETIQSVIKDFYLVSPKLSLESNRRTLVFISKIQEELGQVAESLQTLKEAHQFIESKEDQKLILIQELRLMAYLGMKKNITNQLAVWNAQASEDYSLDIELNHALLWAEYCLFGFKHVRDMAFNLNKKDLTPTDRRLVLRDFLEIAYLSGYPQDSVAQNFLSEFKKRSDLLSFDQFLVDIYQDQVDVNNYFYHDDLSIMQKIRILILKMQVESDIDGRTDLRKKFQLLTAQFSAMSLKSLTEILPHETQKIQSVLRLNLQGLSANQTKLLTCFMQKDQVDIQFLSRLLWDEDFSDAHYDRIRMLIYKTNKLVKDQTSFELFKVTKFGVSLKQKFQLVS